MEILLLILGGAFFGYLFYIIFIAKGKDCTSKIPSYMQPKKSDDSDESVVNAEVDVEPVTTAEEATESVTVGEQEQAPASTEKEPAVADTKTEEPAAPAEKANQSDDDKQPVHVSRFIDPESGQTAANPSNYRFAKKWVKEAMVKEGLLDHVYKNNELKGVVNKTVKEALANFKLIEKYHAEE